MPLSLKPGAHAALRTARRGLPVAMLLLALPCTVSGCRAAVYQELLETQNRQLERHLRELEWENEDLRAEVARNKGGQGADKGQGDAKKAPKGSRRRTGSAGSSEQSNRPPREDEIEAPLVDMPEEDESEPKTEGEGASGKTRSQAPPFRGGPKIQPPDSEIPEGRIEGEQEPSDDANSKAAPRQADPAESSSEGAAEDPNRDGASEEADRNPPQNGAFKIGLNSDGTRLISARGNHPGGLRLLVEPRDSQGRLVKSTGAVSVVVLDPNQEGVLGKLARWDFTAAAAAQHFKESASGRGLHFDLAWPDQAPAIDKVDVYVRLVTDDGRKLVAEQSLAANNAATPGRRLSRANSTNRRPAPARGRAPRRNEPTPADMGDEPVPAAR